MSTKPNINTCPACGTAFPCNPGDCWCNTVPLSMDALLKIQNRYIGCLCEPCLRKFASVEASSTVKPV